MLRQVVVRLQFGLLRVRSVEIVQQAERALGPDGEPAKMTTGRQLQQVQTAHVHHIHACKAKENDDKMTNTEEWEE